MKQLSYLHQPQVGISILRIVTGFIFLMHGWQKISEFGLSGFTMFLTQVGIPFPGLFAIVVIAVEFFGGLGLIFGFGTRWIGLALTIDMLVALFTVHIGNGFFVSANGYELVLILFGASLSLAFLGGGSYALDSQVFGYERRLAQSISTD